MKRIQSIARYISVRELVLDAVIVLFTTFILGLINPEGKKLIETMSPTGIFLLGLAINFAITLFMGSLYRSYTDFFDAPVVTALIKIVFFLGITGAYLALILFFAAYRVMPWSGLAREMDILIVLIPAFPLFWGFACGFSMEDIGDIKYVLYIPMTVTVPMVPVGAAIIGYHTRWFFGIASFVVMVIVLGGPYLVRLLVEKKSEARLLREMRTLRENASDPVRARHELRNNIESPSLAVRAARTAWDDLALPVMAALAMLFWQNMTMEMLARAYRNWDMTPDMNVIFWSLFLSGIVPLRILSQMTPPLRPVNMAIAALSMAYYIISLFRTYH